MSDSIRAVPWYDVMCDECGRWASCDFGTGMLPTRKDAVAAARRVGFKGVDGKQLCPKCVLNAKLFTGKGQGNHGKQASRQNKEE